MKTKDLFETIKNCLLYAVLFAVHTSAAVVWYFITFAAAKVICLSHQELKNIPGQLVQYVFKGLELFFLILGAVVAVVYFITTTYLLLRRIVREAHSGQDN